MTELKLINIVVVSLKEAFEVLCVAGVTNVCWQVSQRDDRLATLRPFVINMCCSLKINCFS
jgi:hypothetical protein